MIFALLLLLLSWPAAAQNVSTFPDATDVTGFTYYDMGPGSNRKLGFDTSLFGIAAGRVKEIAPAALTDGATVTPNLATSTDFTVTEGSATARTYANPTNAVVGRQFFITRTVGGTTQTTQPVFGTAYRWPSATQPTFSTTIGAEDWFGCRVRTLSGSTAATMNCGLMGIAYGVPVVVPNTTSITVSPASPITAGATITLTITLSPSDLAAVGATHDYVGIIAAAASDGTAPSCNPVNQKYLNGVDACIGPAPGSISSSQQVTFTAPAAGSYQARLYFNDSFTVMVRASFTTQ